jgi:GT2 family glycosyltransferase
VAGSTYGNHQVIVVDHGPEEEQARALRARFAAVAWVRGDPSQWWAGATNVGTRAALAQGVQYVMWLNGDCCLRPGTLTTLVRHLERAGEAIVSPVQKDAYDGRILSLGAGYCFTLGFVTCERRGRPSVNALQPVRLVAGGRGALIPARVIERVGLLDEGHLPHYYADHDFYLRCRAQGVQLYVASDAAVLVDRTTTTSASDPGSLTLAEFRCTLRDPRSHRNIAYLNAFFRKHYPLAPLYRIGTWLNIARYAVVYVLRRVAWFARQTRPEVG